MQTSFCSPQKKWRTPHAKTEHHSLRSATFHLSASWADGQFYVAGHQFRGRKVSGMDRRWHSGCAHRPWAFADRTDIPGFPFLQKTLRKAECSVLGKTRQWACHSAHALFPYWRIRQSTGWRIYSISVHNGPAADAAFTGRFGICASAAQSPAPSGIAGHRPG